MHKGFLSFTKLFISFFSLLLAFQLQAAPLKTSSKAPIASQQKPILIAGAMDIEVDTLIKSIQHPKKLMINHYHFVTGTYKGYPVVIAKTEQGSINATIATTLAIEKFNPIIIVNVGTAGGYTNDLHTNDIVIAQKSFNSLTHVTRYAKKGEGSNINEEPLRGVFTFDKHSSSFKLVVFHEADPRLLQIAKKLSTSNPKQRVIFGTIATSDSWNSQVDRMQYLNHKYGAVAEEMETDAIAQVSLVYDIPFISMRVVSNSVIHEEHFNPQSAQIIQHFALSFIENFIRSQHNFK